MAVAENRPADLLERAGEVVDSLSGVLAYHGGGLVLEGISADGRARVSFTGMCSHCSLRPVTLAAILRPGLESLEGITAVEIAGLRISEEAELRLNEAMGEPAEGATGKEPPR